MADNINNLGGRIHADSVLAIAKTDINNTGDTISAGHELIATAGRDINVETAIRSASSSVGGNQFSRTTIDQIGSLSVTGADGTLVASAGRDINLVAAKIDNAGKDGNTLLDAGRNLNLATVTTTSSNSVTWDRPSRRVETQGGAAEGRHSDTGNRSGKAWGAGRLCGQSGKPEIRFDRSGGRCCNQPRHD